ncbi:MAG: DUF2726 domain-containing protein [Chloroflexi bacterium]|nr:DUF2726 domain-containing protein [Chloroflexota bacterium]
MDWIVLFGLCAITVSLAGLAALAVVYVTSQRRRDQPAPTAVSQVRVSSGQPTQAAPSIHGWLAHIPPPAPPPHREPLHFDDGASGPEGEDALEAKRALSKQERALFHTLYRQVGADYYIFPQIPLKQFAPRFGDQFPPSLRSMWQDGVLDFALADPFSLGVLAGIELDDSSHQQADAEARDRRKDQLLNTIGIDVLRISSGESWNPSRIQAELKKLVRGNAITFLTRQECSIFRALRQARGDLVFPRVSLRQMIRRMSFLPRDLYTTLQSETAGFLLANSKYLGTVLVVESADELRRCPKKLELYAQARIPCVVVDGESVEPGQLGEQIELAIQK